MVAAKVAWTAEKLAESTVAAMVVTWVASKVARKVDVLAAQMVV